MSVSSWLDVGHSNGLGWGGQGARISSPTLTECQPFSAQDRPKTLPRGAALTVTRHLVPGTIVRIDLSEGFRPPGIGKRRPAVVLSPLLPGRPQMCTTVPLSTTPPNPVLPHHMPIRFDRPLPHPYSDPVAWLKGDIVLTVAFRRPRAALRAIRSRVVDLISVGLVG